MPLARATGRRGSDAVRQGDADGSNSRMAKSTKASVNPVSELNIRDSRTPHRRHQIGAGRRVRFPSVTWRVRLPLGLTLDELSDRKGCIRPMSTAAYLRVSTGQQSIDQQ